MPHDFIGWLHTRAAIIALITGSMILYRMKGDLRHRRTGRVYAIAMLIICATSFLIFRVHGGLGFLHIFAFISTVTLLLGMAPLYLKKPDNYLLWHLGWMYWSVIGLYCAFAAELFTRLPMIFDWKNSYGLFYALVGISTALVGMVGSRRYKKLEKIWKARYAV